MKTANRTTDLIFARGLIAAETIAQELRERLAEQFSFHTGYWSQADLLYHAREILREYEPLLAEAIANTDLAAWIAGFDSVAKELPEWTEKQIAWSGYIPPRPPGGFNLPGILGDDGDSEPQLRFPMIEKAARSLFDRNILTKDKFDAASQSLRNQAFTVAGESSQDVLETIRDTLGEAVADGQTFDTWRKNVIDRVGTSHIGEGHLETVFRTNVMTAYSDGYEHLASDPIVSELFPYQEYFATHDARCEATHLALETLGLNGTGVYRRDDPMWEWFTPPWRYNCRCTVNPLTVEAAARRGVKEAEEWLRTGMPPAYPEYRLPFIHFRPPVGFGGRRKVAA